MIMLVDVTLKILSIFWYNGSFISLSRRQKQPHISRQISGLILSAAANRLTKLMLAPRVEYKNAIFDVLNFI